MRLSPPPRKTYAILFAASLLAFAWLFVRSAWVVDDAYITFRTIDNFLSGNGLQWNVGERVQVYTHPLWMAALCAAAFVTREYFVTALALSFLCSVGAVLAAFKALNSEAAWRPPLFVLLLLTSKAVIDYSSSGLENPLNYLFIVLFAGLYLRDDPHLQSRSEREVAALFLVAALSCLNRLDTILLYFPMLAGVIVEQAPVLRWRLLRAVAIAWSPVILWFAFATFYYGFPLPNTAYAKMMLDIPLAERLERGSVYFMLALRWDAVAAIALVYAMARAWQLRVTRPLLAAAGILLYLAYVWVSASAATHMAGRFLAVPFVLGIFLTVKLVPSPRVAALGAILAIAISFASPVAPWKLGTPWYHAMTRSLSGYIDTVWFAHREGSGLLTRPAQPNVCLQDGQQFRLSSVPLRVGGCGGGDPIGYFAFAAGPTKWVVDPLALSDPLLARLTPCVDFHNPAWRPGHFRREIPPGYVESIERHDSRLADPGLREYFGSLRAVVSGPLWSWERLMKVVQMNAGAYDRLLEPYNREVAARAAAGQCQF